MKPVIVVRLDRVMKERGISLLELSEKVGVTNVNLSRFKTGKMRATRFDTLARICHVLDCQPGDILECVLQPEEGDILLDDSAEEDV